MRVFAAQINPTIGDFKGNKDKILRSLEAARAHSSTLVVFPELTITGYPPEDFLLHDEFIEAGYQVLADIVAASQGLAVVVGLPTRNLTRGEKALCNSAAIIEDGKLLGYQHKTLLPTYDVFDERRYFAPSTEPVGVWPLCGENVGVVICEDMWQHAERLRWASYKRDPVVELSGKHPQLVVNLSASPFSVTKSALRFEVFGSAAKTLGCPVIFCNQVGGNDSLVFDGYSSVIGADGHVWARAKGFEEDYLAIDTQQMKPVSLIEIDPVESLYKALVLGLRDYFHKHGFKKACLGLSGGIDSAVVACLAVEALGKGNVLGVAMPSRYSSEGSITDAKALAHNLEIEIKVVPIEEPFGCLTSTLEPHFEGRKPDITEENLQARVRGVLLMAISNKLGHIVLSTGNKSELAVGYSTLYGDMVGGLGVINDVTKKQVYALAHWINRDAEIIPASTMTKEPSAELRPNQKDSDSLPSYEVLDTVLNAYIEELETAEEIARKNNYPLEVVYDLVKRIHRNEYKRRQAAPGLRVTEKSFSAGRRFPIVQKWI